MENDEISSLLNQFENNGLLYCKGLVYPILDQDLLNDLREDSGIEIDKELFYLGAPLSLKNIACFHAHNIEALLSKRKKTDFEELINAALYDILPQLMVLTGVSENIPEEKRADKNYWNQKYLEKMNVKKEKIIDDMGSVVKREKIEDFNLDELIKKIFMQDKFFKIEKMVDNFYSGAENNGELRILFMNGGACTLEKCSRENEGSVRIGSANYSKMDIGNFRKNILQLFKESIDFFARKKIIENIDLYKQKIDYSDALINYLFGQKGDKPVELDFGGCGLVFYEKYIDVFVKVEQFALSDFKGGYYVFPETKIWMNMHSLSETSIPMIREKYMHPFVWPPNASKGHYWVCTIATEHGNRWTKKTDFIVYNLFHTKKVVESGYNALKYNGMGAHSLINNQSQERAQFYNGIKTAKDSVLAQKIRITNEVEA